jgi:hypothetical protein
MAIIDKPNNYFNTMLYTANGAVRNITEADTFQADLVWLKRRNAAVSHHLVDSVRGATKAIYSNATGAEATDSAGVTGFVTDGFSLGAQGGYNDTGTFVAWTWKESATAGFDILTYEGSGSAQTVSHNLGVKPDMIIVKNIDSSDPPFNWRVYHSSLGAGVALKLNGTDAIDDDPGYWNDTEPTSSVFSVKDSGETNNSSQTYIAYLFAQKQGFSKFGSYTGNGNADGTFVYTGFKPAFIMFKETGNTSNWTMYDTKRIGFNQLNYVLVANANAAEWDANADHYIDILSNGVKFRGTSVHLNRSGGSYIYMAFAENPFVTSPDNGSVPATAK